ncbi:MAG: hypothetical protein VB095_06905 [Anaerovorax sp.]|nr:hypothetical protein [Anaerovorax sp.]
MYHSIWISIIFLCFFYIGIFFLWTPKFQRFPKIQKATVFKSIVKKKYRLILSKGGKNIFLHTLIRLRSDIKKEKYESEIYEGISYLRNLIAIERGVKMSTPWILEELADLQGVMQQHYLKLLHFVRVNHKEQGLCVFAKNMGTTIGADYGRLLLQWEEMDPKHWWETLRTYQTTIKEMKRTNQRKKDELLSDFIYLPVVINVMLVLINFIYVAYFIEQQKILLWMFQ